MGNQKSSLAKSASADNNEETPKLEVKLSGERGRSVNKAENIIEASFDDFESETESDSGYDSDNSDEEEEDEDFAERLRILDDAKKLKELAVAFLHPEKPIVVDPTVCARCHFDRPSAPQQEDLEESEYRRQVLEDASALKKLAVDYAHPEIGVVTSDATATARCYFDRPSVPQQEDLEEAEYRRQVLEDTAALKKLAIDYAHPEIHVKTSDSTATARCYFDRPSAPQQEVLSDTETIKKLIRELKSLVSSYFDRVPEHEYLEELEYRDQVLEDVAALKKLAIDYAHPEIGVVTSDATASARCYFDRPSAPQQEDLEESEYRRQILKDASALKKLAVDYAHPELGVVTSDATATARCYFDRPSVPQQEDLEYVESRRQVLEDAAVLKKLAIDYAHPEIGVVTSDPTATARCYFNRASAPQQDNADESEKVEYRRHVLEDATALKKLAIIVKNQAVDRPVKAVDSSSKDAFVPRSVSSVKLFGLDGGFDESYC